ncbi:hypothetical protein RvY_06308 [Ramazzottius varieornatus]|uniref:Uncharacterized protein n=1 Tax=Ramazzottius varieornatus TaxID=947166 RepID=A0A1D1V6U0_RAMVA|nr:hypothetical protein RvY_06308 [Ramazzottius varieornatus]
MVEEIKVVLDVQKKYWKSLQYRALSAAAPAVKVRGRPKKGQKDEASSQGPAMPQASDNTRKRRTG